MELAALNWAVLAMTGSAIQLGLINASRLIPVFALSLAAEVLADRFDRRRLLPIEAVFWINGLSFVLVMCTVVANRSSISRLGSPIERQSD